MTEEVLMTDEQLRRIHDIEYSCDSREELAERIVGLEDELAKWERLTAGIELPEYPITQFQPKDLERENKRLREENAKLREFASEAFSMAFNFYHGAGTAEDLRELKVEFRELGLEAS